ncbi:CCAAT/enhancer-binding protein zeta [Orchesella cincta]|uniref:CCAAT/enhancer-binding protein zeta n=1 Tax=Orchesella cincta TaxID=48709 RepID=A0A1D2MK68_ORCCI|nr:CCAAT/enhancer-binding protein zeta [Orchesella cincta]
MNTLKDLFLEDLLPPSRKLLGFEKRRDSLSQASKHQLIMWIYEDRLKMCYSSFIDALRRMSLDNVDKVRAKAVVLMYTLLTTHPEHEAELLQMLVNKLGDPIKKVGSRALFYLNSLLASHPRMKIVVIDEVERLLFRNNIAKRAQYYGVCFLNTINLEDEHPEVACKLINVYVAFFKGCIKTGDIDSKMMSGLLTGLNKAYPLAKEYGFKFTENTDTLYKIVHMSSFNIGIQALSILFQLTDPQNRPNEADRYYRALYSELLRPEIAVTSQNTHFLNLVFKSMKHDNNIGRVMGFCKRLMQICQSVQPNLACAILFLLSEVSKTHKNIIRVGTGAVNSEEEVVACEEEINEPDDDDADSEKKSRNDENMKNLIKRSNVKVTEESSTTEKPKTLLGLRTVPLVKNNHILSSETDQNKRDAESGIKAENENASVKVEYKNQLSDYDPTARNPIYCGAEFSLSYEIVTLVDHFHPSVALFARKLLQKGHIEYEGNPLKDFTITRFLERFVYKNPKKPKVTPGVPRTYQPKGLRNIPVNSNDYLKNEESKIPVEEKFFYRFFTEKKAEKLDASDEDSETESVGDDEFDDLMDNYFKSSKGKNADEDEDDFDKKKIKKLKGGDMFAPAEQFAEMLESNADFSLSAPSTLINKDNADPKQLQWEMERDRWMKGYKGSSKTVFKNKRKPTRCDNDDIEDDDTEDQRASVSPPSRNKETDNFDKTIKSEDIQNELKRWAEAYSIRNKVDFEAKEPKQIVLFLTSSLELAKSNQQLWSWHQIVRFNNGILRFRKLGFRAGRWYGI